MAGEEFIIWFIVIGFILGKKIPLNKDGWRRWWWGRKGIAYYLVYILQGGTVIHEGMVKQSTTTFSYDKGRYLTFKKDPTGKEYSPSFKKESQEIMFYNKNNTNPLDFQETRITPSHNDPEIFQTIIKDESIRQALSPEIDLGELKRYMLVVMGILGLAIAGIMYFLVKM